MSSCISILGSTGSIGRQTLDVADQLNLRVAALTANRDVDRLEAQCRKYRPRLAAMMDERAYQELKARLSDMNITVVLGLEGLVTAASLPEADTVVTAVSGMVGLKPTLAAHPGEKAHCPCQQGNPGLRGRACHGAGKKNTARKSFPSTPSTRQSSSA